MKLYLHQFGIPSCALNSELPVTSRCHIVQQFNAGMYDIIIASDEKSLDDPTHGKGAPTNPNVKKVIFHASFNYSTKIMNISLYYKIKTE